MATKSDLKRGDVVTSPSQLSVGDVIAIVDRERLLQELPAVMARVAILRYHDTTEARSARAGITKAGPGDPNHFHGILNYVSADDEADAEPTGGHEVLISTENDEIGIRAFKLGDEMPDLPADPLYVSAGKL